MERHFERDLEHLQERVRDMGAAVQWSLDRSIEAMNRPDRQAAQDVIAKIEPEINNLHRKVDALAFDLLAILQPMAGDLRFVTAAMRVNGDLERIGDRSAHIARRVLSILSNPIPAFELEIPRMADTAQAMVRDAVDAFLRRDVEAAREILDRDGQVDRYRDEVFEELTTQVHKERQFVHQALDLILISRDLERIAGHATNIAKSVVFLVLGKDIRHHGE